MKGFASFIIIACIVLLVSCNAKNQIQEITGASAKQAKALETQLAELNISCKIISLSQNPMFDELNPEWEAYDIVSDDDTTYMIILRKSDKDFTMIFDGDGNSVYGSISNEVLPSFFEDRQRP